MVKYVYGYQPFGGFMDTKAFAECMKRNMDKYDITTEALSDLSGISVARLEELKSGCIKPKAKELHAISAVIKVPPLILMKGGGKVHFSSVDENGHRICRWDEY